jgi:hypothetical protein
MNPLRVMVLDAWDEVSVPFDLAMKLAEIKTRALGLARVTDPADDFLLKFRGAELRDETVTVAEAGLPESAPLIVLRRQRRAVR